MDLEAQHLPPWDQLKEVDLEEVDLEVRLLSREALAVVAREGSVLVAAVFLPVGHLKVDFPYVEGAEREERRDEIKINSQINESVCKDSCR